MFVESLAPTVCVRDSSASELAYTALLSPTLDDNPRAANESLAEFITKIEHKAILRSLDNLMTFPCIKILADRGKLQLHGAYFGVARGSLSVLDRKTGEFAAVNG